jgi:hypothetical protein
MNKIPGDSRKLRWKNFRGEVSASINPHSVLDLFRDDPPEDLSTNEQVEFIKAKKDKGSRVFRAFPDLGSGKEEVFIKTFSQKETWQVMTERMRSASAGKRPHHYPIKLAKLLYQPSLAKRCWNMSRLCEQAGIPVAGPLLYLERRNKGFREEVLAVKGINPRKASDARAHFTEFFTPPLTADALRKKREALEILALTVRKITRSKIMLPDLKLHNLVLQEVPGGKPCFVLVDLSEAFRVKGQYPEITLLDRFSIHLLRMPCFTKTDLVRLVKTYLGEDEGEREWKKLCDDIYERARKRDPAGFDKRRQ